MKKGDNSPSPEVWVYATDHLEYRMIVGVPYLMSSGFLNLGSVDIWAGSFLVVWVCPVHCKMWNSILQWMPVAFPTSQVVTTKNVP